MVALDRGFAMGNVLARRGMNLSVAMLRAGGSNTELGKGPFGLYSDHAVVSECSLSLGSSPQALSQNSFIDALTITVRGSSLERAERILSKKTSQDILGDVSFPLRDVEGERQALIKGDKSRCIH
jgi:hypothetical protein